METKTINVKISPFGGCSVDTVGFTGQSCKDATKLIETAIAEGKGTTTTVIKEEWFQQEDHAGGIHVESNQSW